MINTINSNLIRGNIDTIILKALYDGDRYGYDIVKEIEQKSSGRYILKQPTLYSSLKRLEVQGFIRSYWGAKSSGGRRKYYTLTDMGKDVFNKNRNEWEYSRTVVDKLISDREYGSPDVQSEAAPTATDYKSDENTLDSVNEYSDEVEEDNDDDYSDEVEEDEEVEEESDDEVEEADEDSVGDNLDKENADNNKAYQQSFLPNEDEPEAKQSQDDFNVSNFLETMLNINIDDKSYTGKLVSEKYSGNSNVRSYSSDTYFNDFVDATADDAKTSDKAESEQKTSDKVESKKTSDKVESKKTSDKDAEEGFLSYKSPPSSKNENEQILDREYVSVLGQLLGGQNISLTNEPKTRTISKTATHSYDKSSPISEEMRANIARVESNSKPKKTVTVDNDYAFIPSSKEDILNKSLTKLAEQTKEYTGEIVKNRIYDSRIDTLYRTQYHYYCNKLKLFQYAILFAIMLVETIATFIVARMLLNIYQPHDLYFYFCSVLLAASLPIAAAIMNFLDSERVKTGEFRVKELKESLFYKVWVMICFFIIIYCVNIFLGMPASFSKDYLATLMLPSLLALCFPISSIIFYILYNSRKFNMS